MTCTPPLWPWTTACSGASKRRLFYPRILININLAFWQSLFGFLARLPDLA